MKFYDINDIKNLMMTYHLHAPCPYLSEKKESILAANIPNISPDLHQLLTENGFRHSGNLYYYPKCKSCKQCIPLRVLVNEFILTKSQKKCLNKNFSTTYKITKPNLNQQKVEIYNKHQNAQNLSRLDEEQKYEEIYDFLYATKTDFAKEIEYYIDEKLVAISIVEVIPYQSCSSVYHYFDPDYAKYSLGTFSAINEILLCKKLKIPYYYLGFWVPDSKKMTYKARFSPHEIFINNTWISPT